MFLIWIGSLGEVDKVADYTEMFYCFYGLSRLVLRRLNFVAGAVIVAAEWPDAVDQ